MNDRTNDSSMVSASPNRLLNRSSQQSNPAKKLKVTHTNGIRPASQEGNSTVRSSFISEKISSSSF